MSGRGTAGGVGFQRLFAAIAGALMLADRPLNRLSAELPGAPRRIHFETDEPVDDLTIVTDVGLAYVQAKRQLSLSPGEKSELRSVADQFVTQYRRGVHDGTARRPLDPLRDRLVLAVGEATPDTIKVQLKDALERYATGAATAVPVRLTDKLNLFRSHVAAAWQAQVKSPIPAGDAEAILRLCRVIVIGSAHEAIAAEALSGVVAAAGDETALFAVLCKWGTDGAGVGTGGDPSTLRAYLSSRIRLAVPADLRGDVERLRAHSAAVTGRLARFRTLSPPEGEVAMVRPVTQAVITAARSGSFLLTGEPGAGKSAVLHAAGEALAVEGEVAMLSVEATSTSLDALRRDIGLERPLTEVLAALPGRRPAFLLIDALDAGRGGLADTAYRQLIEAVSRLEGWRVVASVRSFDLRMGKDLRRAFRGAPVDAGYADPDFATVSHLHVPLLEMAEMAQATTASPSIARALAAGGDKLQDLVRNPFNLGLLADLLRTGAEAASLAGVSSRGQLLERYWLERIEDLGVAGLRALNDVTIKMLADRSTTVSVLHLDPTSLSTVEEASRRGVLVQEASGRVAFRHHVLFDYALARVALAPDEADALRRLSRSEAAGLLLAPALGYWLELRFRRDAPADFWRLAIHLLAVETIDPVVRVETARLLVELIDTDAAIAPLIEAVTAEPDGAAARAVAHLVGSLHARVSQDGEIAVTPWADLARQLPLETGRLRIAQRALVSVLLGRPDAGAHHKALNEAAVRLLDEALADPSATQISRFAIGFVARTYAADPAASRRRLEQVLAEPRFQQLGFIEAPALAQEIRSVAAADPDFALEVYRKVFGDVKFDRNQSTPMGDSWILPLTSNAAQDFEMARYALAKAYPSILAANPNLGAKLLVATLRGEIERDHKSVAAATPVPVAGHGRTYEFVEDYSHIWAWDLERERHQDYAKIYRAFTDWASSANSEDVLQAAELVLEGGSAVMWRAAFNAAAHHRTAAVRLFTLATNEAVLRGADTSQAAIRLIAAAYPHLPSAEQEAFENALEAFDFTNYSDAHGAREQLLAKVFAAIGEANLATRKAVQRLQAAVAAKVPTNNDEPVTFYSQGRTLERHEWIRGDVSAPPNPHILSCNDAIDAALETLSDTPESTLQGLVSAIGELADSLDAHRGTGLLVDVDRTAGDTIARACQAVLALPDLKPPEAAALEDCLIALADHPLPEVDEDTEAKFARSPSWGSPSPRVRTAEALMTVIARRPTSWPRLAATIERMLAEDPHPAVRSQFAGRLLALWAIDRDTMWRLLRDRVAAETNASVLGSLVAIIDRLRGEDPECCEDLFLSCIERLTAAGGSRENFSALLVHFATVRDLPASRALLAGWLGDFEVHKSWLRSAAGHMSGLIALAYDAADPEEEAVRKRAQGFLREVVATIRGDVVAWSTRGGEPSRREIAAVELLDAAADAIYHGAGAVGRDDKLVFESAAGAAAFLRDTADLIRELSALGTPRTVHHMLETLQTFIPFEPALCFDLIAEALLRTTGVASYQYEQLGAALFVDLVGIYLADYRALFEDPARRAKLVDCLHVFVDAGWPEARRLFQRLPELLA